MLSSKRVLITEDDLEIADILRAFFERSGAVVQLAYDGEAALALARSFRPDLLLLDLRIPKKDGFSVLVAVRDFAPELPVMLITALGDDVDRLSGFRLGADDYIVKPFNRKFPFGNFRLVFGLRVFLGRLGKNVVFPAPWLA
jgi:two-component system, OmpR family, response regulator AdeR